MLINGNAVIKGLLRNRDVLGVQVDATLDPGATPTAGDRYIITSPGALHSNFGAISGVGAGDIVEYIGSAFEVKFDASAGECNDAKVWDQASDRWYAYDGSAWTTPSAAESIEDLTDTTIASVAAGELLIYNGSSSDWRNQPLSGDISVNENGLVTISNGVITNDKVDGAAAIDESKLALDHSTSSLDARITSNDGDIAANSANITTLDNKIGPQSYGSQNYVTNGESATDSINALDLALQSVENDVNTNTSAIAGLASGLNYRGVLAAGSDITGNATGNAYLDGGNGFEQGDFFKISGDGVITVSDGTVSVSNGDNIYVNKVVANDASIVIADLDIIDNTESPDLLRQGDLAAGQVFVGNGSGEATAVALSGDVTLDSAGAATISAEAVDTGKLAADAVTQAKIGPSAVGTTELENSSVTEDKLATNSVTSAKLDYTDTGLRSVVDQAWTGASLTRTVNHALGTALVKVECFNVTTGESFIPDSIDRSDTNNVVVTVIEAPGADTYAVLVTEAVARA